MARKTLCQGAGNDQQFSLRSNESYDITVTASGNGNGTQTKRLSISP
jgi:hypothetical protein